MPYNTLPNNPSISVFDFKVVFDLSDGKIKVDLSPSVFQNPAGVTGFKVRVTTPNNTVIFNNDYAFTAVNITSIYQIIFPKVQGIYIWGIYKVEVIMTLSGVDYTLAKSLNVCAVDPSDYFANEIVGSIILKLDCRTGRIYGRGFTGYAYKNQQPISEDYNITFYFPPEADLSPLKFINAMPFSVNAYVGNNTVKGVNISTYDFTDNVFAKVRITASQTKDARCDVDIQTVFCALRDQLTKLRTCASDASLLVNNFGEIDALLWLIFVGINDGEDMGDEISRVEDILQISCACQSCAGTAIGPVIYIDCPQIKNAQATVDNGKLIISFNSAGVPESSALKIEYRPYCDTSTQDPFTVVNPNLALTGFNQVAQININETLKYQVKLTVVKADSTECPPVLIQSDNDADCPGGSGVIGEVNPNAGDVPVVLVGGTTMWQQPPYTLVDKIVIYDENAIGGFKIGLEADGAEKWPPTDYAAGTNVINPDIYTGASAQTLYFGGTALTTTIIIYPRQQQQPTTTTTTTTTTIP